MGVSSAILGGISIVVGVGAVADLASGGAVSDRDGIGTLADVAGLGAFADLAAWSLGDATWLANAGVSRVFSRIENAVAVKTQATAVAITFQRRDPLGASSA